MIGRPGSTPWLLAWEMRLAWRGLIARRGRKGVAAWAPFVIVAALMLALGVPVGHFLLAADAPGGQPLVVVVAAASGMIFLLMLSQTLASAAETLYDRGDLDLLFASPIAPRKVVAVKFLAVALNLYLTFATFLGGVLVSAALVAGPRWLGGLGLMAALALAATASGLALALGLIRLIGPRRTRTAAQVASALIGAAIFLAVQGPMLLGGSRLNPWRELWAAAERGEVSLPPLAALPLRAALGDPAALAILGGGAAVLYAAVTFWLGERFVAAAAAAKGADVTRRIAAPRPARFSAGAFSALVRKELRLLLRDTALLSQVFLRVLYLVPLALVLARAAARGEAVALPGAAAGVVFLAGQVAGSLSWITLSGEEAPDLLASAPARATMIMRGKLVAALIPLAAILIIPLAAVVWLSPRVGLITAVGAAAAAVTSGLINIWHQKPGRRGEFRARRGSTWYAMWAEASVCGLIAAATAFAALGSVWALAPALVAAGLMGLLRRNEAQIAEALRAA